MLPPEYLRKISVSYTFGADSKGGGIHIIKYCFYSNKTGKNGSDTVRYRCADKICINIFEGNEFVIKDADIMNFVTFIQDEVHKTAIEYHRKLREKKTTKSLLDEIEGVGEKRKEALLKHFKSIKKIANATIEELENVEGIDRKTAENIYNAFH